MSLFGAFLLTLIIALLFAPGYRKGSFGPFLVLFLILLFGGIASQLWIIPYGPMWGGVSWMPLIFVLLIFTFLFAAPSPYEREEHTSSNLEVRAKHAITDTMSIYLWLLFSVLILAVLIGLMTKTAF